MKPEKDPVRLLQRKPQERIEPNNAPPPPKKGPRGIYSYEGGRLTLSTELDLRSTVVEAVVGVC